MGSYLGAGGFVYPSSKSHRGGGDDPVRLPMTV